MKPFGEAFVGEMVQDTTENNEGRAELERAITKLCEPLGITEIEVVAKVKSTLTPNSDYQYDDVDDW